MKCGIYQIRNLVDGKVYIGSSCRLKGRMASHKSLLNRGTHHSAYLQSVWNKYGERSFVFEVLEICPEGSLLEREQWYLDNRKPYDRKNGYNSARFSEAPTKGLKMPRESVERAIKKREGFRHTESSKEKLRQAMQGIPRPPEHRKACALSHGSYPFFAYTLEGAFVGEFFSSYQAAEILKISPISIRGVLRGFFSQSSGYVFDYVKNGKHSAKEIQERLLEATKLEAGRRSLTYATRPPVVVVLNSRDGSYAGFRSLQLAADSLGISFRTVRKYLDTGKVFKGYIFIQKSCKSMQLENLKARAS